MYLEIGVLIGMGIGLVMSRRIPAWAIIPIAIILFLVAAFADMKDRKEV
jgi:hypothetical protein